MVITFLKMICAVYLIKMTKNIQMYENEFNYLWDEVSHVEKLI